MIESTDKAWERWGAQDPYYGVLTFDRFKKEHLNEKVRAEFFESGKSYIELILDDIKTHLDPGFAPKNAVDFGCGVGRLLIPLAEICDGVIGIDVSESMLTEARKNLEGRGITNVELIKSDDELSQLKGTYDLIHSFIVFPHIPTRRGEKIFKKMLNHLSASGIGVHQFTYYRQAPRIRKIINWMRRHVPLAHNLINLIQGKPFFESMMQVNAYDLNRLVRILHSNGIQKIFTRSTYHASNYGLILYFQKESA